MFQDLTGRQFGRLTVIERAENDKRGNARWLCLCDCGNICIVEGGALRRGYSKSCGCYQREKVSTHGKTNTSIHKKWENMMARCYNENSMGFDNYGGRGIKVCERWKTFENFYEDVSVLPHFGEKGYSLDRINNDGDYCPENVRWADLKTQNRNKRNNIIVEYQGEKMILKDAAEKSGINYKILHKRYKKGLRGDDLFAPIDESKSRK